MLYHLAEPERPGAERTSPSCTLLLGADSALPPCDHCAPTWPWALRSFPRSPQISSARRSSSIGCNSCRSRNQDRTLGRSCVHGKPHTPHCGLEWRSTLVHREATGPGVTPDLGHGPYNGAPSPALLAVTSIWGAFEPPQSLATSSHSPHLPCPLPCPTAEAANRAPSLPHQPLGFCRKTGLPKWEFGGATSCSGTIPGPHCLRIKSRVHKAWAGLPRALMVTPTFQLYPHSAPNFLSSPLSHSILSLC